MAYLLSCYQTRARTYYKVLCKKSVACIRSISLPQCDGLVENFNKTLQTKLAKHAKEFGPSWDVHLQQMLFAYWARPHSSTGELPFYMVFGLYPHPPTETTFTTTCAQYQVDAEDYCTELTRGLQNTWQQNITTMS